MLVLARRVGEEIVIDGRIRIRVTEVQGNRVRLGITTPEKVRVDRAEVHECRGLPGAARPPHEEPSAADRPGVKQ
jgi:carbon storage regulator